MNWNVIRAMWFGWLVLILVSLAACLPRVRNVPTVTLSPTSNPTAAATSPKPSPTTESAQGRVTPAKNTQYGVLLPPGMAIATQITVLQELGVTFYRPAAFYMTSPDKPRPDIDTVAAAGHKIVLVVRASGENGGVVSPPTDLSAYGRALQGVLARYRPAYLVVEDEQDNQKLFYSGTPQQYLAELQVACQAAREMAIPCVTGGFTPQTVIWLKVRDLLARSQGEQALAYVQHTYPILFPDGSVPPLHSIADLQRLVSQNAGILDRAQIMLDGYPAAGADYLNFHWYAPDREAITGAVEYLRQAGHGLTVLTDEIGQRDDNPDHTVAALSTVRDLGLPLAVWFSVDIPQRNGAHALTEPDGKQRKTGDAFARFMRSTGP